MRVSLMGTKDEVAAVLAAIKPVLEVQEVSNPYRNRGESTLVRVYVTVGGVRPAATTDSDGPLRAASERVDRAALPASPRQEVRRR